MQRLKGKIKLNTIIKILPSALFLAFIIWMAVPTFLSNAVKDEIRNTEISFTSLSTLTDDFEEVLQKNFYEKNNYINLNGLATRALGINSLNERQKMADGHLTETLNISDTSVPTQNLIELNQFLNNRGIEFMYVLAPHKSTFYDAKFAPGYTGGDFTNLNTMMAALADANVNAIDMNNWFKDNKWTIDDVYYKTDHHWKPQAALAAVNVTMSQLSDLGLADYNEELLDESNYTITTLKDWFLGSHGKRTGILYDGVDDFDVIVPDFATDYTYSEIDEETNVWQYYTGLLDEELITKRDYFGSNPYGAYMHGNCAIQKVTNTYSVNKKRILITGDSFKLPFVYFMTTQFEEVYTTDLRNYTDGTFAQFVEEIQPDIVIMCANNTNVEAEYSFGVSEYEEALNATVPNESEIIEMDDVSFTAQKNTADNFTAIAANLEPGQTYTMTVGTTAYTGNDSLYIQLDLQDLKTNTKIYSRYFNANSDETQRWIFTVPESDDSTQSYAFYLFDGTKEPSENASIESDNSTLSATAFVEITDIKLREGIFEN